MSKYLNEDSRKHHYESTIESTHIKRINYITTMREYANEYHHTILGNAEQLPKRKLSDAMRYYEILFDVTKNMLIQIENNMYEKDVWEESMQLVNFYVDSMETIANYRGTNGKDKSN